MTVRIFGSLMVLKRYSLTLINVLDLSKKFWLHFVE